MKEYILCSTVWFKDGEKYDHQPKNVDSGFVICGRRHHNCFFTAWNLGYDREQSIGRDIQGFLTNTNRFVDRDEAAVIAYKAGQIKDRRSFLISEDLY